MKKLIKKMKYIKNKTKTKTKNETTMSMNKKIKKNLKCILKWILPTKNQYAYLALVWNASPNKNSIMDSLITYYEIWPPFQWATSLISLILIYWATGYLYNKFLSQKGGWMDTKTRVIMIIIDLILNFCLGIYYMNYRDTFIGALMLQCPVFCSPLFWLIELVCFYVYYKYISLSKSKKS